MSRVPFVLALVCAALMALPLVGFALSKREPTPVPVTYCAETATELVPRCPPEARTRVIATYTSGLVLTVSWTGNGWVAHLPGGRTEPVPMPHDWREP